MQYVPPQMVVMGVTPTGRYNVAVLLSMELRRLLRMGVDDHFERTAE